MVGIDDITVEIMVRLKVLVGWGAKRFSWILWMDWAFLAIAYCIAIGICGLAGDLGELLRRRNYWMMGDVLRYFAVGYL